MQNNFKIRIYTICFITLFHTYVLAEIPPHGLYLDSQSNAIYSGVEYIGADGSVGINGVKGVNGTDGKNATPDIKGIEGNNGSNGNDGSDGSSGYHGLLSNSTNAAFNNSVTFQGGDGGNGGSGGNGGTGGKGGNHYDNFFRGHHNAGKGGRGGLGGNGGRGGNGGVGIVLNHSTIEFKGEIIALRGVGTLGGIGGNGGKGGSKGDISSICSCSQDPILVDGENGSNGKHGIDGKSEFDMLIDSSKMIFHADVKSDMINMNNSDLEFHLNDSNILFQGTIVGDNNNIVLNTSYNGTNIGTLKCSLGILDLSKFENIQINFDQTQQASALTLGLEETFNIFVEEGDGSIVLPDDEKVDVNISANTSQLIDIIYTQGTLIHKTKNEFISDISINIPLITQNPHTQGLVFLGNAIITKDIGSESIPLQEIKFNKDKSIIKSTGILSSDNIIFGNDVNIDANEIYLKNLNIGNNATVKINKILSEELLNFGINSTIDIKEVNTPKGIIFGDGSEINTNKLITLKNISLGNDNKLTCTELIQAENINIGLRNTIDIKGKLDVKNILDIQNDTTIILDGGEIHAKEIEFGKNTKIECKTNSSINVASTTAHLDDIIFDLGSNKLTLKGSFIALPNSKITLNANVNGENLGYLEFDASDANNKIDLSNATKIIINVYNSSTVNAEENNSTITAKIFNNQESFMNLPVALEIKTITNVTNTPNNSNNTTPIEYSILSNNKYYILKSLQLQPVEEKKLELFLNNKGQKIEEFTKLIFDLIYHQKNPTKAKEVLDRLKPTATAAPTVHNTSTRHVIDITRNSIHNRKAQLGTLKSVASGDDGNNKYGVWFMPLYGTANHNKSEGAPGYSLKHYGAVIGMDSMVSTRSLLGFSLNLVKSNIDYRDSSEGDTTILHNGIMSIYTSHDLTPEWFVSTIGFSGYSKVHNQELRIEGNKNNQDAINISTAGYGVSSWGVEVLSGYKYKPNQSIVITPIIGCSFYQLGDVQYQEEGAVYQNLIVKQTSFNKFEVIGGARFKLHFKNLGDTRLNILGNAYLKYDLLDHDVHTNVKLVGNQGNDVFLTPTNPRKEPAVYNFGLGLQLSKSNIDYELDYNYISAIDYEGHNFAIKLKLNF